MLNELGRRMEQKGPLVANVHDALNAILAPSGLTFEEFAEKGFLRGEMEYRKYLKKGFSTPTGKVELYSTRMKGLGIRSPSSVSRTSGISGQPARPSKGLSLYSHYGDASHSLFPFGTSPDSVAERTSAGAFCRDSSGDSRKRRNQGGRLGGDRISPRDVFPGAD